MSNIDEEMVLAHFIVSAALRSRQCLAPPRSLRWAVGVQVLMAAYTAAGDSRGDCGPVAAICGEARPAKARKHGRNDPCRSSASFRDFPLAFAGLRLVSQTTSGPPSAKPVSVMKYGDHPDGGLRTT